MYKSHYAVQQKLTQHCNQLYFNKIKKPKKPKAKNQEPVWAI